MGEIEENTKGAYQSDGCHCNLLLHNLVVLLGCDGFSQLAFNDPILFALGLEGSHVGIVFLINVLQKETGKVSEIGQNHMIRESLLIIRFNMAHIRRSSL